MANIDEIRLALLPLTENVQILSGNVTSILQSMDGLTAEMTETKRVLSEHDERFKKIEARITEMNRQTIENEQTASANKRRRATSVPATQSPDRSTRMATTRSSG